MRGFDRLSRVVHGRNTHPFAEIPVVPLAHSHGFLVCRGNLAGHLLQLLLPTLKDHPAVKLEGTHVVPSLGMKVIEYLGVGEIAVKGEVAGYAA